MIFSNFFFTLLFICLASLRAFAATPREITGPTFIKGYNEDQIQIQFLIKTETGEKNARMIRTTYDEILQIIANLKVEAASFNALPAIQCTVLKVKQNNLVVGSIREWTYKLVEAKKFEEYVDLRGARDIESNKVWVAAQTKELIKSRSVNEKTSKEDIGRLIEKRDSVLKEIDPKINKFVNHPESLSSLQNLKGEIKADINSLNVKMRNALTSVELRTNYLDDLDRAHVQMQSDDLSNYRALRKQKIDQKIEKESIQRNAADAIIAKKADKVRNDNLYNIEEKVK